MNAEQATQQLLAGLSPSKARELIRSGRSLWRDYWAEWEKRMIQASAAPYKASIRTIAMRDVEAAVQRTRPDLWAAVVGEAGGRMWLSSQFSEVQRELAR